MIISLESEMDFICNKAYVIHDLYLVHVVEAFITLK